ncbi:MAG TPA: 30S ribosomal protein S20 [Candidatus Sulfotelmatobacter sp.]|jgi:small subunit ribosomal protein S20|nr:30S ribosomal protein S20 [Candidatus Sulfotelmatobacter sp.]
MPILKHAKKKLKQDKKRTIKNRKLKDTFKSLIKKAKEIKTPEALSKAFSAVDKAAKKNILNKNKAAHMKSALTKHVASDKPAAIVPKKATKSAKTAKSSGAKAKPSSKKK